MIFSRFAAVSSLDATITKQTSTKKLLFKRFNDTKKPHVCQENVLSTFYDITFLIPVALTGGSYPRASREIRMRSDIGEGVLQRLHSGPEEAGRPRTPNLTQMIGSKVE